MFINISTLIGDYKVIDNIYSPRFCQPISTVKYFPNGTLILEGSSPIKIRIDTSIGVCYF